MNDNQNTEQQYINNAAVEMGAKLRHAREQKGFSIGEVAERLKLPARQIEGLESGNYEGMPEAVFIRGFLRTYGRFLGLDENEVASYLDRILPQNRSNLYAVERNNQSLNYQQTEIKKSFPKWVAGLLVLALVGSGVYVWQNKSNLEYAKQTDSNIQSELSNASAPNLQASNISVVAMGSEAESAITPASQESVSESQAVAASAITNSKQQASEPELVQASAPALTVAASDVALIAADELVVKVRYRSNLVIKDKDGQFVINKIVPAGSEHRFRGGAPYNVWIGYASGATANYGGQDISVSKHMVGKKTSSFIAGQ
ncbi:MULTISPECIES: RodZ domain-containing protein [unclassified Neisseria]|uniref:RodZ domain-containing protein n=1 Tax=unclassified Neisseria TaxID=2623750 RepID=UPI002665A5B1|nr:MULTISPECIES: RodZ domain-containing protein [unclassified Neisseria]MDO1509002.1 DUF4115 domain-containing protein [Neisseria sp. MVDL19-042950]MDO1515261.1 DUF4115 domain-containing protein [Neisseria sp. MVDL18-041461]MDO1562621.1 DUF4115 domain-containing protein [Neisseria sp. MVDL20-010259]